MDVDFESELTERETIVDDLKRLETDKKDLELALAEAKKELNELDTESSKNKQILSHGCLIINVVSKFQIFIKITSTSINCKV